MAPIKFEDNIREKLEGRELQPSSNAWKKLQEQLPEDERKSNSYLWLAIAASFIGVVVIGSFLFNSSNNSTIDSELVVEQAENGEKIQLPLEDEKIVKQLEIQEEVLSKDKSTKLAVELVQKDVAPKKIEIEKPKTSSGNKILNNTTIAVAQVTNKERKIEERPMQSETNVLSSKNIIIDSKIDEVVAQVKAFEKENSNITAQEINALLAQAQRDIATQRILNSTKIDAAALLDDVELDLERTFRDKVFDALGDGYSKIRTAVVERNN